MRPNRNTDGHKPGAANRRSPRRRYRMAAAPSDAGGPSVPIENMSPLERLRYASDYFFTLAERERKRGDRADLGVIVALMQAGAMAAAKAAPYQHPKFAATKFKASQPKPKETVDFSKLTDDELEQMFRLVSKASGMPTDLAAAVYKELPSDE
jgi:hypothetical protein